MEKRPSRRPPPPRASAKPVPRPPPVALTREDFARLEARVTALEAELAALKASLHARRGPPPLPAASEGSIDVSDVAELIEPNRRSRA